MVIPLYKGEVKLDFNEKRHLYTVNGKKIDGVTSVLGVIAKPGLIKWAAECAIAHVKENGGDLAVNSPEFSKLCVEAINAHIRKRDRAATVGTETHQWIERFIKQDNRINPPALLPEQVRNGVEAFLQWYKENKVTFINSERLVYSRKFNYAGTLDFIAKVNGKFVLGDIKTSNGIYDEMFFQTAAYGQAIYEEDGNVFDAHVIVNCKKTGGLEVKETTSHEKNLKAFLGALAIYRRQKELKEEYDLRS